MIVYKFGGALGRTRRGLEALARLVVEAHRKESTRARRNKAVGSLHGLVVVVSAIGHTTRYLGRAAELAEVGQLAEAELSLERTASQHVALATQLGVADAFEPRLDAILAEIRGLLEGIAIVRELSLRTRDMILANGEALASALISCVLRAEELPVREIDARTIIATDDRHGNATPINSQTIARARKFILPRLNRQEVVLTQGFIGATLDGITTTMGSESSDLSATLLASALGAREVVFWKMLPGLFTADPELVPNAKLIRAMSFDEAEELGRRGARVLYPSFAHPLMTDESRTVLRIATPFGKRAGHTTLERTLPTPARGSRPQKALAVVTRQKLVLIRLERRSGSPASSPVSRRNAERMASLLSSAVVVWQSPLELAVVVPREERASLLSTLDRERYSVISELPVTTISAIFRRPDRAPLDPSFLATIAKSLRTLEAETILAVERSIIAVVPEARALTALTKIHRDLIET